MVAASLVVGAVAGCHREEPVTEEMLVGRYGLNITNAADTLILQPDGLYLQLFAMEGLPMSVDTGTWKLGVRGAEQLVEFTNYTTKWRLAEPHPFRQSLVTGYWDAPVERSRSGAIRLVQSYDRDRWFEQVSPTTP
jgi:hypothetical protein